MQSDEGMVRLVEIQVKKCDQLMILFCRTISYPQHKVAITVVKGRLPSFLQRCHCCHGTLPLRQEGFVELQLIDSARHLWLSQSRGPTDLTL